MRVKQCHKPPIWEWLYHLFMVMTGGLGDGTQRIIQFSLRQRSEGRIQWPAPHVACCVLPALELPGRHSFRGDKAQLAGFLKWRYPKMDGLHWKILLNGWFGGTTILANHHFGEARFHDASGLRNMTHSKVTDLYFCRWWNQSFSGNNLNMLSIRVGKICHNLCQLPTFDGKPFEFLDDDMWRLFLRLFLSRCCACVSETNHEDCEKYIKIHEPWLNQYIYCGFYPMPFAPSPKTITMFIGCINYSPVVDGMVWPTWTTWIEAPKASLRWFLHSEHRWTWPMSRY